jgi:hypothetical protein
MATTRKSASSSGSSTRSAVKKTAAKKSTAKKAAPAKKTAAKKTVAKKPAPAREPTDETAPAEETAPARESAPARKKVPAMQVARSAAQQLVALTGREAESVIGIRRTDDGWLVDLEVVESRRIPDSTDVLATYQVETDEDGDLTGYRRVRRYVRGKGGDGEGGGR